MLTILVSGMILTTVALGILWGGFIYLRKRPRFDHFNSKEANRKMLKWTLILYFIGFVLTIYFMANVERY